MEDLCKVLDEDHHTSTLLILEVQSLATAFQDSLGVSRPEPTEHPEEGRHLQLLKGPKTTGSLLPLQQMALLTTYIETLFFWCPLIPLLRALFATAES